MNLFVFLILLVSVSSAMAETVNPGDMTKSAVSMTDIHDIAGLMPAIGIPVWAFIAGTVIAVVIFAIAAFLVWKKFRKTEKDMNVSELSPWDEAFERLDGLFASIGNCSVKEFYFSISEALRRYISRRFAIDAMEMTAEELRPVIDRVDGINDLKSGIRSFIARSELVKFANDSASCNIDNYMMNDDAVLLRKFVELTLPVNNGPESGRDVSIHCNKNESV